MYQDARFLRLPEVMKITGLGRSTIYLKIAKGTFPAPVKIGMRASAWVNFEVDDWFSKCIQDRPERLLRGALHG